MRNEVLYQSISGFDIDGGPVALSFAKRLARENGWSLGYSERVVEEYRRFAYLAMAAGHPVTPSDEVDQAWHLHMLYTESYWKRFCGEVLGKELNHGPTKGGAVEGAKFTDWYEKTLESYRSEFGEEAPADVWPSSEVRFSRAVNFVRVDTAENFVLPKSAVRQFAMAGAIGVGLLALAGCTYSLAQASGGTGLDGILLVGGIVLVMVMVVVGLIWVNRKFGGGDRNGGTGGCGSGCGGSSGSKHDAGDSGDSGSSGCGSSGCSSGCGGGCGGGD